MQLKNGKTPKTNRVEVSNSGSHVVRNEAIDLTEKEFDRKAKQYIGILFQVFVRWASAAENGTDGAAAWKNMSEAKKDMVLREFFELYLSG